MTANASEQQIQKTVRRHIAASIAAGCGILGLVVLGLPSAAVIAGALVIALVVAGSAMHLFSERPSIQVLAAFTAFFVFMLVWWSYEALHDRIEGTEPATFDAVPAVQTGEGH